MEGGFGIECPLINFPSLDGARLQKTQVCVCSRSPSCIRPPVFGQKRSISERNPRECAAFESASRVTQGNRHSSQRLPGCNVARRVYRQEREKNEGDGVAKGGCSRDFSFQNSQTDASNPA